MTVPKSQRVCAIVNGFATQGGCESKAVDRDTGKRKRGLPDNIAVMERISLEQLNWGLATSIFESCRYRIESLEFCTEHKMFGDLSIPSA
jgi:hypothetical protein